MVQDGKDDPEVLHTGTEYRHEYRPNDAEQLKAVHREMVHHCAFFPQKLCRLLYGSSDHAQGGYLQQ